MYNEKNGYENKVVISDFLYRYGHSTLFVNKFFLQQLSKTFCYQTMFLYNSLNTDTTQQVKQELQEKFLETDLYFSIL